MAKKTNFSMNYELKAVPPNPRGQFGGRSYVWPKKPISYQFIYLFWAFLFPLTAYCADTAWVSEPRSNSWEYEAAQFLKDKIVSERFPGAFLEHCDTHCANTLIGVPGGKRIVHFTFPQMRIRYGSRILASCMRRQGTPTSARLTFTQFSVDGDYETDDLEKFYRMLIASLNPKDEDYQYFTKSHNRFVQSIAVEKVQDPQCLSEYVEYHATIKDPLAHLSDWAWTSVLRNKQFCDVNLVTKLAYRTPSIEGSLRNQLLLKLLDWAAASVPSEYSNKLERVDQQIGISGSCWLAQPVKTKQTLLLCFMPDGRLNEYYFWKSGKIPKLNDSHQTLHWQQMDDGSVEITMGAKTNHLSTVCSYLMTGSIEWLPNDQGFRKTLPGEIFYSIKGKTTTSKCVSVYLGSTQLLLE